MPVYSRLPMIAATLDKRIEKALQTGANRIASEAQARVPVDSGRLRDNIHVTEGDEGGFLVIAGNEDVFYGHLVENGGAHTAPRPFLLPAAEASRQQIVEDVTDVLRDL